MRALALALAALCFPALVFAGVAEALADARAGRYARAQAELERLAAAGDGEARLELGRLLWSLGRRRDALRHFTSLVEDFNRVRPADSASMVWAGAAGAYTGSSQQAIRILGAAQKADPANARAFLEAGILFARAHQAGDAQREIGRALELAPGDATAQAWLARVKFDDFEFDELKAMERQFSASHPDRHEVRLLLTRVTLLEDEAPEKARATLAPALAANPSDPESLSLLAALEYLAGNGAAFEQAARRALAVNPLHAGAFGETAQLLARKRRREEAEGLWRRALAVDPADVPALAGLGKLLLDTGRESEGRDKLEEATKLDPFRVPSVNLLKTLDLMDEEFVYAGRGNLLFRYHPWRDAALEEALPEFAATSVQALAAAPGFSQGAMVPPTFVLVEVLPEHRWFTARLVGVPWNGPVGACEGNLVLLDPPRKVAREVAWRDVMHHELAHAFHLTATKGQVPNWFTEGLATFQEGTARALEWDGLLSRAIELDDLIPFDRLNEAFISPPDPAAWLQAYCQAELAIEFTVERYGPLGPSRLLDSYRQGLRGGEAIRSALGVERSRFASQVEAYWKREAQAVKVPPSYRPGDVELLEQRFSKERTPAGGARLARALLQNGAEELAARLLGRLRKQWPQDALLQVVAAEAAIGAERWDEAARQLEAAEQTAAGDFRVQSLLALALAKLGKLDRVERLARAAIDSYGRDPTAYVALVELARAKGDRQALKGALDELARMGGGGVACRVERARLSLAEKDPKSALELLDGAADIDPGDAGLLEARGEALEALGRPALARRAYRDMFASLHFVSVDGAPSATSVAELAREARSGDGPRAQGAAEALGICLAGATGLALDGLAGGGGDSGAAESSSAAGQPNLGTGAHGPRPLARSRGLAGSAQGEVAHRVALARGRRGLGAAVPGLLEALGCADCRQEALDVLAPLTCRPAHGDARAWRSWWETRRGGGPASWLEEAVVPLGYPLAGKSGRDRLAVLVVALEDERWYIREGALAELRRTTGRAFGAGAFGKAGEAEPALAVARREALDRWKSYLREL